MNKNHTNKLYIIEKVLMLFDIKRLTSQRITNTWFVINISVYIICFHSQEESHRLLSIGIRWGVKIDHVLLTFAVYLDLQRALKLKVIFMWTRVSHINKQLLTFQLIFFLFHHSLDN